MRALRFVLCFLLPILAYTSSTAQIPRTISYQGMLRTSQGVTVPDGSYALTIRIYDVPIGGTALYSDNGAVSVNGGVFSVVIGLSNPIPPSIAFDRTYFLGLTIDAGAELVPRTQFTAVPYALHATVSDTSAVASSLASSVPVVTGLNTLTGAVDLVADSGMKITTNGNTLALRSDLVLPYVGVNTSPDKYSMQILSKKGGGGIFVIDSSQRGALLGYNDSDGYAGLFRSRNAKSTTATVRIGQEGNAQALQVEMLNSTSTAAAITVDNHSLGGGMTISLGRTLSAARGLDIVHGGVGPGVVSTTAGGNAVWGITSSISAAGVIGDNTFGEAVVGRTRGGTGVAAVVGRNDSSGYGVRGFNTKNGIGVLGQAGISGGTGVAGRFENVNATNGSSALEATTNGNGNVAKLTAGVATSTLAALHVESGRSAGEAIWARQASTTNVAPVLKLTLHPTGVANFIEGLTWDGTANAIRVLRIDKTGKGFFNGGTQNSGADLAEEFDVVGTSSSYEPGDVLTIARNHKRTVELSSTAYSTAVLGVYATKPGILLTERLQDTDGAGKIPMGVVGVLPTKVCDEGGVIEPGDLLVTSSRKGYAMKADPDKLKFGMVLGKALESFSGKTGVIEVFVNVK